MAERNNGGTWVRAALWLLVVLVLGAYAFAYAVDQRATNHAQDSNMHPNKEYLDEWSSTDAILQRSPTRSEDG